ncbi:CRISPR-associated protein, Csm2 family [Thermococcus sp. 2319x1]|uniref:type III-A CRISPR-associated protein Csm2 n=1 Tax=Thermococcus sp. 2319x1 TaxID=1674923 RepID=UPI00073AD76D|nr:type III-A CRISPR-associated protein Csm2 [Thermococcus sp. 2319x1]ALV63520.1 CRISPR-associated protein, Csm2 family [Thermococcus sp. 2319x1]
MGYNSFQGGGYSRNRGYQGQRQPPGNDKIEEIKRSAKNFFEWSAQERLQNAMELGKYLSHNLKTNQIRRVLEIARRIHLEIRRGKERDFVDDVVRMRYLLAYAVGKTTNRNQREALKNFYEILDQMLDVIMKPKDSEDLKPAEKFEIFYDFLQAVVAYHKFYGGVD